MVVDDGNSMTMYDLKHIGEEERCEVGAETPVKYVDPARTARSRDLNRFYQVTKVMVDPC